MRHHKLKRRLYQWTAQIIILLLVTSGYGPPSVYARPGDQPHVVDEQVFSLDELTVTDDHPKNALLVHGPEKTPQTDVVQRPVAPQETTLQAQSILSISVGSVITVISSRGVHNDPTLSADGRRVAFWSTANLAPKRPIPNTIFINEIYAYESIHTVEIYNGGIQDVDMTGWRLTEWYGVNTQHVTYTFPSFTLDAGAYVRLYNRAPAEVNTPCCFDTGFDYIYDDGVNDGGAVRLQDSADAEIDFVRWGNSIITSTNWVGTNPLAPRASYCYQYCFYFWGSYYFCFCMPETLGRNAASFDSNTGEDWCRQKYTLGHQNDSTCGLEQENPDGNIEIYMADVETPQLGVTEDVTFTQVSRSMGSILGGFNLQPSVSGDGARIAFFSDRDLIGANGDENFEIFLYDVASKQIYSVTESLKGANILPSINGDGTRIAFVSDRDLDPSSDNSDGNQEIFFADVDGSWNVDITQVTETSGDAINDQPSISADGNRIAFVSNWNHQGSTPDDNLEIFVVDIGVGRPYSFVRVTTTSRGVDNEQPSIDGDGSRVAYTQLAGSTSNVYWAEEDTGPWDITMIPATGRVNENPAINSYGDRIVFVSGQSVVLYYTEFSQATLLATVLDTSVQPSHPDIATTASYMDTWVVFAAGGTLYHAYYPLQDISIGKAFEPQQVGPGDTVTYTIQFANYGMYPAPNAYITDSLPAELLGAQCFPGGYPLIPTATECRWNLGALSSGTQGVVTVTGIISTGLAAGYQITNTAVISSDAAEPNTVNNIAPAVITIINLPPTARDDAYSVAEDGILSIAARGVLTNDVDLNADTLTATLVTGVSNGDLLLEEDGGFTYTPTLHYNGTDVFVYRAHDGHGGTSTATVTITVTAVNDPPVNWLPDPQTITEDHALTLSLSSGNAITVSDVDAGGNAIQVTLTVRDGTLTLGGTAGLSFSNGDGTDDVTMTFAGTITAINTALDGLVFSPTLNFSGTTDLQMVSDDQGFTGPGPQTDTDTLSITVIGVNDAPVLDLDDTVAGKDAQHTYEGADPDKWIAPNASVSDIDTQIAYATVTLLNHPDGVSETLACGDCGLYGITSSYSDATYTLLMTVTQGAFNYQEALKSVTYDNSSKPPQLGDREIEVVIYDTGGLTDTAVSTITLINSRPVATDDLALTQEETPVDIDVLLNDDDVDGDPIEIIAVGPPSHGTAFTVTVGITVMIRYTPENDFVGTDVFTYTIRDLPGGTDTATVTVTVSGDNDPPINTVPSGPYPLNVNEDQVLTFSGVGNTFSITDVDAYTNAVQVSLVATNGILFLGNPGSVSITSGADGTSQIAFTGTITNVNTALNGMEFSPTLDYNGPATITIRTDDLGFSGSGGNQYDVDTVPINVVPQPDAPRFTSTPVPTATYNVVYIYNITTTDPDGPGPIAITAPILPSWLVLVDNGDGTATLSGTPGLSDRGIHDVTLEATDATPLVDTQVFTIEVFAPELSVVKHASHPDPLLPGSTITYTIIISNIGTLVATNVTVSDTAPTNTTYVPQNTSVIKNKLVRDDFGTQSFSNNDGPDNWEDDWIEDDPASGGTGPTAGNVQILGGNLRLDDQPDTGGEPSAAREVDLSGFTRATLVFTYYTSSDVDPADDVVVEMSSVGGPPYTVTLQTFSGVNTTQTRRSYDISSSISANTSVRFRVSTLYGGNNEFFYVDSVQIEAWNAMDNSPASGNPQLDDGTPPRLLTAADGFDLKPGETLMVTFAVQVGAGVSPGTEIVNTAAVTSTEIAAPETASVTSTVRAPDLALTKSGPGTISTGDRITYTIVVANNGNADATGAVISDTTPISTTFVPGSITLDPPGAGTIGGENTLVTNLTITAGQQVTVTFVVTADSSGTIRNTASVTSSEVTTPATDTVDTTVATILFDDVFWVRDETIGNGSVAVAVIGLPALMALVAPRRSRSRKKQRHK